MNIKDEKILSSNNNIEIIDMPYDQDIGATSSPEEWKRILKPYRLRGHYREKLIFYRNKLKLACIRFIVSFIPNKSLRKKVRNRLK